MITKEISYSLALAVAILGAAAAVRYAESLGMLDADAGRRTMQVVIGVVLASYANFMPKRIGRSRSTRAATRAQSALRVGGWSITLAGLAYAGLWALAPIAIADVASMAVVMTALVITFTYAGWSFFSCRHTTDAVTRG